MLMEKLKKITMDDINERYGEMVKLREFQRKDLVD